jgi:hypothetical protein
MPDSVYIQTSIGGYIFDAYLNIQHENEVTITEHPIETGAAVSDHAYIMPSKLTFQIGMTDCAQDIIPGQFSGGSSRAVTAYSLLQEMKANRIPMEVVTRLATYENMLVQSVTAPDDHTTAHALKAAVVMQEIMVAVVKTVKISSRAQVTDSRNKGTVQPTAVPQTAAHAMFGVVVPAQ